jgi:hypothetical protein
MVEMLGANRLLVYISVDYAVENESANGISCWS